MATRSITGGATDLDGSGMPVFVGARYSAVMADAVLDMPLQDDAASTVVTNNAGTDGTLLGGDNTADLSTTGPTTWLPKALAFDGAGDTVRDDSGIHTQLGSFDDLTLAIWYQGANAFSFLRTQGSGYVVSWWPNNSSSIVSTDGGVAGVAWPSGSVDPGEWRHLAVTRDRDGDYSLWVNGVVVASRASNGAALPATGDEWYVGSRTGGSEYTSGDLSGAYIAHKLVSVPALYAGPEPTVTATTLAFSAGQLTADLTHDNPNNGAVTKYALIQRNNAGTWETASEGAGPLTFTPTAAGDYRAIGIATNNGGDSVAVVSSTVAVTLSTPRFPIPLITPLLTPVGA